MVGYRQNKNIVFRQEDDEAILFNPSNSAIIALNSTGCLVWSLCGSKNKYNDIIKKLVDEFEVTPEKAKHDLDNFLFSLEKINFIEKVE